ncbi:MAG: hypothetical protein QOH61_1197, partial [Chloroflexota bacterium]|nr:hypothetical protein [Chloroflexota bacterium]
MPGARHLTVVLLTAIWIVSACASVAPAAQTTPPVPLATGSGASPTAEPPSDPPAPVTAAPTVHLPTVEPSRAPVPTATTQPTAPEPTELEAQPNLVFLEFVVEEDPVLVGNLATLTATAVNIGSADAGPFIVEIVLTTVGQADLVLESKAVEGLAVGDSTVLTTSINPNEAAEMRLVARVDVIDQVSEEDESDNQKVLEITVKSLGNINVPADGFTVTAHPDSPGTYLFYFTLVNTGPSTLVAPISV